jgi:hypothetical protein
VQDVRRLRWDLMSLQKDTGGWLLSNGLCSRKQCMMTNVLHNKAQLSFW